jgi:hypothetical protein
MVGESLVTSIHVRFRERERRMNTAATEARSMGRRAPPNLLSAICYLLFGQRLPPPLSDFVEARLLKIGGTHNNSKFDLSVESEEPRFG